MSNEPTNQGPLQTFENGAARIKIWEQQTTNGKNFPTASVTKIYKAKDGQWKESRNFTPADLQKLQQILPEANQEITKWQDYYNERNRQNTPEPQPRNMVAERDAAMQAARGNIQEQNEERMQSYEHTHQPDHAPSIDRGR